MRGSLCCRRARTPRTTWSRGELHALVRSAAGGRAGVPRLGGVLPARVAGFPRRLRRPGPGGVRDELAADARWRLARSARQPGLGPLSEQRSGRRAPADDPLLPAAPQEHPGGVRSRPGGVARGRVVAGPPRGAACRGGRSFRGAYVRAARPLRVLLLLRPRRRASRGSAAGRGDGCLGPLGRGWVRPGRPAAGARARPPGAVVCEPSRRRASMTVPWPDHVDEVLAGDMTAALAYLTPAGGAVVTAVAPVGLRDREQGTVTFTTSLGFGKKLQRIELDPCVALAYHAREHGFARGESFVLVQGRCRPVPPADRDWNDRVLGPAAERFMGPPRRGRLEAQSAPKKGTGPRLDAAKAAARLTRLPHVLVAWREVDGFPAVVAARVAGWAPEGIGLASGAALPEGGRRAGLLGHSYEAKLVGLRARQHTGWLEDGVYAPHTASSFRAPRNKTLLLLANGLLAKQGLRKARREGRA